MKPFKNMKKIIGLIAAMGLSLVVLGFFLIFIFFHYTAHSYFSTNKIWAYTKLDYIPWFHLSRAEVFMFPKPMKVIKQEKFSFMVFFPDTQMVFRYTLRSRGAGSDSLAAKNMPVFERHGDEPLLNLKIEGSNGDLWEYTSPTVYELLSATLFGPERGVINIGQKAIIYSPKPGVKYTITLKPNAEFIKNAIEFQDINFMHKMQDKSSNSLVQGLIRLNQFNQFLSIMWFVFLCSAVLGTLIYFLGKTLIKEIK